MDTVAQVLDRINRGDPRATEDLLPLVYDQLRAIAQRAMNSERRDHTLQATALVNEAYLRLFGDGAEVSWGNRGHFFTAAAEAMRRILIEHARSRARIKRGGDADGRPAVRIPLSAIDLAESPDEREFLTFDEDIRRLELRDAQAATIVRLRVFAGLTVQETALSLGISPSTVDRDWAFARAWLFAARKRRPASS